MVLMATSDLPLRRIARGKVRDVYEVDDQRLLLVATDRVSAYDVVMAEPIPTKGAVLTQLSAWWFRQLADGVRHHMFSARRPRHAVPARHGVSHRMRDPRLPVGLGLARICPGGHAGRREAARRPA
jgi:phosphoribosylaminoimidazole-succinocarboxamide synthase